MKSVEVATKDGVPAAPVLLASTVFAPAVVAYEVVLPTEVTTPERLAFVVTFAAVPPMESEEVATCTSAVPSAFA